MAATGVGAQTEGVQSHTSRNGHWKITTRKQPILKAEPIEALSKQIGIPIPEMIFGDNFVSVTHVPTKWSICFNAQDALDRVSKTEQGMLQVAVAEHANLVTVKGTKSRNDLMDLESMDGALNGRRSIRQVVAGNTHLI